MKQTSPCPVCGHSDYTAKVSAIFIEGIQRTQKMPQRTGFSDIQPEFRLPAIFQDMTSSSLRHLSNRLKPPDSGAALPIRPVHPDLIVAAFSLASPIFLYEIFLSQPASGLPVLSILVVFYIFYFWKRKSMLDRFELQKCKRRDEENRVKKAVEHWMRLYYCANDDIVFEPRADSAIPADQLKFYLLQNG
jgi:hypothetical protein